MSINWPKTSHFDVKLNCSAAAVRRTPEFVAVHETDGTEHRFDEIVLASHADASLAMLADADSFERYLLGQFSYSDNLGVLHSDVSAMPKRRRLWSSWNYMASRQNSQFAEQASVTYWMNSLQKLNTQSDLFVSVNPINESTPKGFTIRPPTGIRFSMLRRSTRNSRCGNYRTQPDLVCGSYFGYGFHEDGLQSGLAVARGTRSLRRPWDVEDESAGFNIPTANRRSWRRQNELFQACTVFGHGSASPCVPQVAQSALPGFFDPLDLDHIGSFANTSRLFSHNRWNVLSIHDRDHADGATPIWPGSCGTWCADAWIYASSAC